MPSRSKKSSSGRISSKRRSPSRKRKESKEIKPQRAPKVVAVEPGGFDLMSHVLVPRHEIVPPDEREGLIKKYGPLKLFPKILTTDPVVRQLGAKPGDVIKIMRPGERVPAYRVVVRGG